MRTTTWSVPTRTGSPSARWTSRACACVAVLEHVERAVVEDRAVLVDLDQRRAPVLRGRAQRLGEVLAVGVGRAGHERGLGAEGQRDRVERVVHRAHRGGLGDLADLGRRGVLALGQAVDPVVEQQDLEVDVAAQRVDQVVATDREGVTVAGDDPHRQVTARRGQAGGDGRGAPVDRVHAVGVEVVREARGAADARDEDDVLALEPEVGQEALHRGEDRVVAAAGAPAHLLVGGELLLGLPGRVLAAGAGTPWVPVERHTEVDGGHQRLTPSVTRSAVIADRLVQHVGQVGCGERQPTHLRVALHVDEVLRAQQQRQLPEVHLRHDDPLVGAEHVAGVGRERVEVAQVGPGDPARRCCAPAGSPRRSGRRSSPSRARARRRHRSGRRPRGRGSWRRCRRPWPGAGASSVSWLSGS